MIGQAIYNFMLLLVLALIFYFIYFFKSFFPLLILAYLINLVFLTYEARDSFKTDKNKFSRIIFISIVLLIALPLLIKLTLIGNMFLIQLLK